MHDLNFFNRLQINGKVSVKARATKPPLDKLEASTFLECFNFALPNPQTDLSL